VAAPVIGVIAKKFTGTFSPGMTAAAEPAAPDETIRADVVVLGGGAGGMTAAIRARQQGVETVVLLEKRSRLGGNAVFAPVPETGILNSQDIFTTAADNTHWGGDARIIGTLVDKSREVGPWLKGLSDEIREGAYGGMLVAVLKAQCEKLGVRVLTGTRARKILKNDKEWTCGVLADRDGKTLEVAAPVTILATGGFLGEPELMRSYFPCYDDEFSDEVGVEGLLYSGDGIKMGLDAGVGNDGTISFEWGPRQLPFYTGDPAKLSAVSFLTDNLKTPEALWVNNVGVRFTDESEALAANAIYRQPNKNCFIVLDQGIVEHLSKKHPGVVSVEKLREEMTLLIEANQGLIADSTGAVAAWIRGKKHILQHAIDVYNASCEKGLDDLYYKAPAALVAFRKPPYYVFRSGLSLRTTHGPLKVNPMMSCVSRFDFPIPGLMACGADIGGLYTDRFISSRDSHAILWAIASGLGAGENAAAFVQGNQPAPVYEFPTYTAKDVIAGNYENVGTVDMSKMPAGGPSGSNQKSYH